MGRPEAVVEQTLKKVVESVAERHKIIHTDYSAAEKIDKSDLFSAFVEFEFEVDDFEQLFSAVIDYGPACIEVIEPNEIKIKCSALQGALSDLVAKIHKMSQAIQILQVENMKLKKSDETTKK